MQKVERNFPATLRADTTKLGPPESVKGGLAVPDNNQYANWHKIDEKDGPPGKYLVDSKGVPVYYVDPGINGTHRIAPDGSSVTKYDAPKATLMSYIIKGILNQQLPWGSGVVGRDDRHRARDGGYSFARICGRCLSAAFVVESDIYRRHGALAG